LLAVSFLISPLFINKKINFAYILLIYGSIVTILVLSIFHLQVFPVAYVEGSGLTAFKIISEYIISGIFLAAIIILEKFKDCFDKKVYSLLTSFLFLSIFSELAFTFYVDVYDIFNMTGHILKLMSYYLLYKAIIQIGLTQPYNLLFLEVEKLNKRKDEFIGMASHELKNPVTSTKAYAQLLTRNLQKAGDFENAEMANKINTQVNIITNLINELLDVSKIEAGKLAFDLAEFSLDEVIAQTVKDFQLTVERTEIVLRGKAGINLFGNKERIRQVIVNFLANAVKYSSKGKKVILKVTKENRYVVVGVQDFGIGIPKDKQKHIFKKYYRTENGERKAEGMGLGLYICHEIIKMHNGKTWLESKEGKGSTFYFALPLSQQKA
jgi:signal transduction histidine kinase